MRERYRLYDTMDTWRAAAVLWWVWGSDAFICHLTNSKIFGVEWTFPEQVIDNIVVHKCPLWVGYVSLRGFMLFCLENASKYGF
jgi:hypothetical protein